MNIEIYGKESCPFCDKAKNLASRVKASNPTITYEYHDIQKKGITKEVLSEMVGQEVTTVPQIFVGGEYVGGYSEFSKYVIDNYLL